MDSRMKTLMTVLGTLVALLVLVGVAAIVMLLQHPAGAGAH